MIVKALKGAAKLALTAGVAVIAVEAWQRVKPAVLAKAVEAIPMPFPRLAVEDNFTPEDAR